ANGTCTSGSNTGSGDTFEENVLKHWKEYDQNKDGKIGWEEYKNTTYDEEFDDVDDKTSYKTMLTRDERGLRTADRDRDGTTTKDKFTAFLHPEEYDHMKAVVIQVSQRTGISQ
uniref:Reticulocalbin 3, EF-hand calcium binding domain n=1 Tax=Hucho hucho TaxID=62062 RepID=A0A4W5PC32_9TELE